MGAWGRFHFTEDTDAADLVFQVNMYSRPFQTDPGTKKPQLRAQPLPACAIWVWPKGADPEKDNNLLWEETYWPKWLESDRQTLRTCVQRLRKDVEDAENLPTPSTKGPL
jgi:hypothetical protein